MKLITIFLLSLFGLFLAACKPGAAAAFEPEPAPGNQASFPRWDDRTAILDGQGAVTVEITPPADPSGDRLDFEVSMNTHSVELNMNLAELATLSTDRGMNAPALVWDGQQGGHHVSGTLSFPASVDGISLLDGATKITLTLVSVDAPERVFAWQR